MSDSNETRLWTVAVAMASLLAGCAAESPGECRDGAISQAVISGNGAMLGNGSMIGNGSMLGNGTLVGNGSMIGNERSPGHGSSVDGGVSLVAVDVEGATLVGHTDTATLRGTELMGATLQVTTADGREILVSIDDATDHPRWPDVTLYRLSVDGTNLCGPDASGIFLRGIWDETATWRDHVERDGMTFDVTFSCATGAIAKCVELGYHSWDGGQDTHQSCVRMIIADYCGDGTPHTEDGTLIDIYDVLGVAGSGPTDDPVFEFEAAWGPGGAVCANRPRYHDEVVGYGRLFPSCWNELPVCDSLQAPAAEDALLANGSVFQARRFCDAPY